MTDTTTAEKPEALRCAEWLEHIARGGEVVSIEGLARTAAAELRNLHELAATAAKDAEDAARYRWLRSRPLDWRVEHCRNGWATSYGLLEMDAAIDAARAKEGKA